jgi:hypothetical protein
MGRYGIDFYGTGARYGNPALVQYSVAPFYSIPKNYGAIEVSWSRPTGSWERFRLVRNSYGFPVDADDGIVLVNQPNQSFSNYYQDTNLEQGRTYYYSIFLYNPFDLIWIRAGNTYGVSVKNFNTLDRMWNYLPIVYRNTNFVTSTPAFGTTIYDYTSSRENEDLRSLLSIFAFEYDHQKTLARNLMYSGDTTFVDGRYIRPMMQQFGLKFEPEIGLQQSRVLLRNAIKIYKTKGSYSGLVTYLKSYTGWDSEVALGKNLLLDSNDSSFEQNVGHWTASAATLALQPTGVVTAPGGSGLLVAYSEDNSPASFPNIQINLLKVTATASSTVTLDCGSSAPLGLGVPVKSANITGVSRDGTYVTYTAANNFVSGDKVTITGLSTSAFNLANATVYSSNGYEFKVASTAAGSSQGVTTSPLPPNTDIPASIGVAGGVYTFSIWGVSAATARNAQVSIKWYDRAGVYLSTSTAGTAVSLPVLGMAESTAGRPTVTAIAPVNAVFATPVVSIASVTSSQIFYFSAAMLENAAAATYFEDSRILKMTFKASRINELKNPNFTTNTQWGITNGTLVLGSSLSPAPTVLSGESLVADPTAVGDVVINSENITTVLPNTTYTFSVYAKYFNATPSAANAITASISWYNAGGIIGIEQVGTPLTTGNLTEFVRPSVTATSPSNATYAIARIKYPTTNTNLWLVLDQALFESSAYVNSYFDGATGVSSLTNLFWEGTAGASRSHYYKNRGTIQGRLIIDLPNYLTLGSQFQLLFAKP